jgi:hypothetical protein
MGVLVPKLYRMLHDPNKGVADAASAIWGALVSDPRAALDEHFDAIVRELLRDLGGRLWRGREAAAGALADALTGRRWPQLAPHFGEVWTMTLRALDDIKESVRVAASGLERTLAALTVRLCDASATTDGEAAAAALGVALPLLLRQGVPAQAGEVRGLAVRTISQIADKAVRSAFCVLRLRIIVIAVLPFAGLYTHCCHSLTLLPVCAPAVRGGAAAALGRRGAFTDHTQTTHMQANKCLTPRARTPCPSRLPSCLSLCPRWKTPG